MLGSEGTSYWSLPLCLTFLWSNLCIGLLGMPDTTLDRFHSAYNPFFGSALKKALVHMHFFLLVFASLTRLAILAG